MNGTAHFLIGGASTALGLWGAQRLGLPVETGAIVIGAATGAASALIPDIDHPHSTISRGLPRRFLRVGFTLLLIPLGLALVSFIRESDGTASGLIHSLANTPFYQWGVWIILPPLFLMGLSFLISHVFGHRGATHSLVFTAGATLIAMVCCLIFHVSWEYGLIFGWGWLSHLLADAITPEGLPSLLWPFKHLTKRHQYQSSYGRARKRRWE